MIIFWLASVAMVAAALAFVIPPLLRATTADGPSRHQANVEIYRERIRELQLQTQSGALDIAQAAQAREELDREMLAQDAEAPAQLQGAEQALSTHPVRAIFIALALPLIAVGVYLQVGTPRLLFEETTTAAIADPTGDAQAPSIDQMVARLEQRLQSEPDDIRGWLMLGRSYSIMQRFEDARVALWEAFKRAPDNPEVMVSYAEVLTALNDGTLDGEPIELVNRALLIEADNPRALWLAGLHALNQGIPSQALSTWQKVLDSAKLDANASTQVTQAMDSVRAAIATAQGASQADDKSRDVTNNAQLTGNQASAVVPTKAAVQVNVSVSPQLRASITGAETVFVFARANNGPPMPVAVQRLTARQLPITVVLDDSTSMAPELALSRFDRVVITARVSRTGEPRAVPGDLQGVSAEVPSRGGDAVNLVIDQTVE